MCYKLYHGVYIHWKKTSSRSMGKPVRVSWSTFMVDFPHSCSILPQGKYTWHQLHICIHIYIYICIYVCIYIYMYTYTYIYTYIYIYMYTYIYLYNIHVLCYTSMCFSSTYHILTYQRHVSWTQYFFRPCVATAGHWASLTNWRHTILSVFLMNLPPEHSFTPPTPAFGNGSWNR